MGAVVERVLGQAPSRVGDLTDGEFNAAFLIEMPDSQEYVMRVAPPPGAPLLRYEQNLMRVEVDVMRLVRSRTEIPIADIVRFEEACPELPSSYLLMRRLPGKALDKVRPFLDESSRAQIGFDTGRVLRSLHTITNPTFGMYDRPVHSSWRDAFCEIFEYLERDAQDYGVPLPEDTFSAAWSLFDALTEVDRACLVHWDLWDGNIFVDDGHVSGVIDFERAVWGDPLFEQNFFNPEPRFIEGYGSDPRQSPGADERLMLYELYLYLVMVIECTPRGFPREREAVRREGLEERLARIRGRDR